VRATARAGAETVMAYGLLGWIYTAAVAACRPDALTVRISSMLPLRRDTFGTCCFTLSAVAAYALRSRTGTWWVRRPRLPGTGNAALSTVAGYALLAWAYLCVNSLIHPETITRPLTHFAAFPTEGTAASWCFALSGAALLTARLRGRRPARGSPSSVPTGGGAS
jgi:hypothetical protein